MFINLHIAGKKSTANEISFDFPSFFCHCCYCCHSSLNRDLTHNSMNRTREIALVSSRYPVSLPDFFPDAKHPSNSNNNRTENGIMYNPVTYAVLLLRHLPFFFPHTDSFHLEESSNLVAWWISCSWILFHLGLYFNDEQNYVSISRRACMLN